MASHPHPLRETDTRQPVLALLRHGEYEQPKDVPSAHLPHPLTETGREQAVRAADELLQYARDNHLHLSERVWTSPLRRAWQTAQLLCTGLPGPSHIHQTDALAERSLGAVANLTVSTIEQLIESDPRYPSPPAGWKRDPSYRVPFLGAESLAQAGQRLASFLRQTASEVTEPGSLVICVGHGGAFRHACQHLGILNADQVSLLSMHYCQPVYVQMTTGPQPAWRHVGGHFKKRTLATRLD